MPTLSEALCLKRGGILAASRSLRHTRFKWKIRGAECGVWKIRSVENEECGKRGVWKMRSVENVECGK